MKGFRWRQTLLTAALVASLGVSAKAEVRRGAEIRFGEGAEQTVVSVLTWKDGFPEVISTRHPDGSIVVGNWDRAALGPLRIEFGPGSTASQGFGDVVVETHGRERRLRVSYQTTAAGVAFEFVDTENPSIRATAVAIGLVPPALPDERVSTESWWAGVGGEVFFYAVERCATLQEEAQEECFDEAEELCGRGNVGSASYTGACGVAGRCAFECGD